MALMVTSMALTSPHQATLQVSGRLRDEVKGPLPGSDRPFTD